MSNEPSRSRGPAGRSNNHWRAATVAEPDRYLPLASDPNEGFLIDWFERSVEASPARMAVITDTDTLTMADLNGQANAVGQRLLDDKRAFDTPIVLFMAHCAEKIAALIGIWKAGAAYACVDPIHKDRGVKDLIGHTRASTVIADRANIERARRLVDGDVKVFEISTMLARPVEHNPERAVTVDTLSAIEFTSGSTGQPKGVMHTQGYERDITIRTSAAAKFASGDRVMFTQNFWPAFLFGSLIAGATVYPFDLRRQGLNVMRTWLLRHRITGYDGMLTGFRQFLVALPPEDRFPDMRVVMVTGEPLHREDVERFDRVFPRHCSLINKYSATEQTLMAYIAVDRSAIPSDNDLVPIGAPAPGLQVRVIDKSENSVPPGTVGEIVVSGPMLSLGYWDNPDLTAKLFRPDDRRPGWRSYRTGDLGVMDKDGLLHLQGRVDQQIKIRGHRVLPGEIENMLAEHPAIKAAAVVLDQAGIAGDRLVGYVVGEIQPVPTTSELRAYLGRRLPDHMVPSVFVPVPGFDWTVSGKVDRQSLPPAKIDIRDRAGAFVLPRDDVEAVLKEIWEELLDEEGISVEDDFFLIGGDSLKALQMFQFAEQRLGRQLPFESLWLQGSTIRMLAKSINDGPTTTDWNQALPMQTNGSKPILFVVSMALAPVYCLSLIPHLGADQPVFGLPATSAGDGTHPDRRIEDMAEHCITMMRRVQPDGPYRLMGHSAAGLVAFEITHRLRAEGDAVSKLVLLDSDLPASTGNMAGRIVRQPAKATRYARSLVGQSLGLNAAADPVAAKTARVGAHFRYRPKRYDGEAILVTAAEREDCVDLAAAWRRLVPDGLITVATPGDHRSMIQEPHVAQFGLTLSILLDEE